MDRLAIPSDDDIALLNAGKSTRAFGVDIHHHRA
jgi:hypothetical protein